MTLRLKLRREKTAKLVFELAGFEIVAPEVAKEAAPAFAYTVTDLAERTITGHTDAVKAVDFLPNGIHAVSRGWENSLIMWDVRTGAEICRVDNASTEGEDGDVSKIAIAPDGSFIVTCHGCSGVVRIRDSNDNLKELHVLEGHKGDVLSVAVHPNSELIACGVESGSVKLWEPAGFEMEGVVVEGREISEDLLVGMYGDFFAESAAPAPAMEVSKAVSWREKKTFEDCEWDMYSLVFSPDGKWLATGGYSKVRMYEVFSYPIDFSIKHTMEGGHTDEIKAISFAPDSSTLVSGGSNEDTALCLWNVAEGTLLKKVDSAHTATDEGEATIMAVAHSANGANIASGKRGQNGQDLGRQDAGFKAHLRHQTF